MMHFIRSMYSFSLVMWDLAIRVKKLVSKAISSKFRGSFFAGFGLAK